ncbi:MAG: hypothetical protein K2X81_22585 [Candidatus Obscuribacterales bacterium]|nr:hypothetical protein [Candidatus Obscuribacterales bacterium]
MKNTKKPQQNDSGNSLAGKRGTDREKAKLVDKAEPASDDETGSSADLNRPSCVDAVHRFGKHSGST